ncbi:MAG: hypothetical protein JWN38_915 [Candidatus Saccharibacteria bacterium]|nr:hypothetical protein [Candidatus Saccharibacteria bacterium]
MALNVKKFTHKQAVYAAAALTVVLSLFTVLAPANGAFLGPRSITLSSSVAGATATHALRFTLSTAGSIGSIQILYCASSPLIGEVCTPPTGLTTAGASLSSQTGQTGFSILGGSPNNEIILTRPPAAASAGVVSYSFDNVVNPSTATSYYVRIFTYASTDATGSYSDYGGLAFAINNNVSVSATVPPYLIFCAAVTIPTFDCMNATGNNLDFGELSSVQSKQATSQMMATTNGKSGYSILLSGTTMTSGNDVIDALATSDVSRPGVSQFGLNLRANSSPAIGADATGPGTASPTANYGQANFYRFGPNEAVAGNPIPDLTRRYTVTYVVNVPKDQPAGVYASTVTYVCLANF